MSLINKPIVTISGGIKGKVLLYVTYGTVKSMVARSVQKLAVSYIKASVFESDEMNRALTF